MFQLILFSVFLILRKSNRLPNRMLAVFLLGQFLIVSGILTSKVFFDYFLANWPHVLLVGLPFFFLAAPSLYLYVISMSTMNFSLRTRDLLHTIPFFTFVCYFGIIFYAHDADSKRLLLTSGAMRNNLILSWLPVVFYIQILLYTVAGLRALRLYRGLIRNEFSSTEKINLNWLRLVLWGFIVAWLSDVATFSFQKLNWPIPFDYSYISLGAFLAFFNIIFFKAWSQPEIFSRMEGKIKYQFSNLRQDEADRYLENLKTHMETSKPYLNPELSLSDLATSANIPPRHLSQIINERLHMNFFDYISQYRIEDAKRQLMNREDRKTVLEILYAVGFNSKSSFNKAFKKFTDTTPTDFRKTISR